MSNVKGLVFRNSMRELEAIEGPDVVERVYAALPADLRDGIRYGTIASGAWVPAAWQRTLVHAIAGASKRGSNVIREIGRRTIEKDLSGVYRVFSRLLGPERLFSVSTRFFNQYYDFGRSNVLESRQGYALVEWVECPEFDALMWQMIVGGAEGILRVCNAEQIRIHAVGGGRDGDDYLQLRGHWV
jgi:hypothetical protein